MSSSSSDEPWVETDPDRLDSPDWNSSDSDNKQETDSFDEPDYQFDEEGHVIYNDE